MAKQEYKKTEDFELYEVGKNYKRRINLYNEVDKNERFYAGKQWDGVVSNGLPTPVFNVMKRVIDFKIAEIINNSVKVRYGFDGISEIEDPEQYEINKYASQALSEFSETQWEALKMNKMNHDGLLDAANSGDMVSFWHWNPDFKTGTKYSGRMEGELIDNVNLFLGNQNSSCIQGQPYIILAYRMLVADAIREAKANGVKEDELKKISADEDTEYQSGDMKRYELEETGRNSGKCIVLLKLWKDHKTGTIFFRKSTRNVVIKPETDTKMRKYPVALMNWYKRKNSGHGVSEASGLIPNQIYINKIAAMLMMNTMYMSFPKLLYDKTRIAAPSNKIGAALGVQGDIGGAAQFLYPPSASGDAFKMLDVSIQTTKEMMGASDAALGEVRPDNTSAIIAVREAAAVPMKNIQERFYQYIEDVAEIWLEFWITYMKGERTITIRKQDDEEKQVVLDPSKFKDTAWRVKIDVGPSSTFSEVASIGTLDNLLMQGKIDITQYLERIPKGIVPKREELIEQIRQIQGQAQEEENESNMEEMAQFVDGLPEEIQSIITQMEPEEMEQHVMEMMQMENDVLNEHMSDMLSQ